MDLIRWPVMPLLLVGLCLASPGAMAQDHLQVPGVVHVHSDFSSGAYSLGELVVRAADKRIEVLVLTDHDWVVMEYGLFPFRNLIKRREERKSVLQAGPRVYLDRIEHLNRSQNDVLLIPGVQSSPFYYWSGSPFNKSLVANDYRKELLVVGMPAAEDYLELPKMHGRMSTRYLATHLPRSMTFLAALVLGVVLLWRQGVLKIVGIAVAVLSVVALIDSHPFKSSRFDPYHGEQGIAPYQEVIDYAGDRDGLVFWAHPESNYAVNGVPLGPVTLKTEHYVDDLLRSEGYIGFSGLYGDTITATDPGSHWDRLLVSFSRGRRASAAWAIAGADFHVTKKGVDIDTFQTIFLVHAKSRDAILTAMRQGHMYAIRRKAAGRLVLQKWQLEDTPRQVRAVAGQTLRTADPYRVMGIIRASDGGQHPLTLDLIKDGSVWHTLGGRTPLAFDFEVTGGLSQVKSYYRLAASSPTLGKLLANPIFVSKPGQSPK